MHCFIYCFFLGNVAKLGATFENFLLTQPPSSATDCGGRFVRQFRLFKKVFGKLLSVIAVKAASREIAFLVDGILLMSE